MRKNFFLKPSCFCFFRTHARFFLVAVSGATKSKGLSKGTSAPFSQVILKILLNRFKAGLFGHRRKLGRGGGRARPRCLNAYIFVNTRAKVSKKTSVCQGFYTLFLPKFDILKKIYVN